MALDRVLAFDAAGAACSAAVLRDGDIAARRFERMARGQSEKLVPMIRSVMAEAGLAFDALQAIAVTVGPGGFTGVRIGLATARALALAADRPLLGLTNFEVVAAAVPERERAGAGLAVALDAKRPEIYLQVFAPDGTAEGAPALVPRDRLAARLPAGRILVAGDAAAVVAEVLAPGGRPCGATEPVLSGAPGLADAATLARLAARRGLPAAAAPMPAPLYLRAPDVTPPRS